MENPSQESRPKKRSHPLVVGIIVLAVLLVFILLALAFLTPALVH